MADKQQSFENIEANDANYTEDTVRGVPNFLLDVLDYIVHRVCMPASFIFGVLMRLAGPVFVIGFYYLMSYHTWVFLTIIANVLRARLGTELAVVWTLIGIAITYNVVWNHTLAMCLRPGSPKDLIVSEHLCMSLSPITFALCRESNS